MYNFIRNYMEKYITSLLAWLGFNEWCEASGEEAKRRAENTRFKTEISEFLIDNIDCDALGILLWTM